MLESTFASAAAGFGGAIYNNGGTITLTNSTLSGNSASGGSTNVSGGIFNNSGTVNARNTIIAKNTSPESRDLAF